MQTTHRQVRKAVAETHPFIRFRVHVTRGYIGSLRFIKSGAEIALMKKAFQIRCSWAGPVTNWP